MRRVVLLYRFLPQYRVAFYEGLRQRLRDEGVDLQLVYGDGDRDDRAKGDLVSIPWATPAKNRIVGIGTTKMYWQPVLRHVRGADLVIVEQASRLLVNYLLLAGQRLGGAKVAFWGHGRNFQAMAGHGVAEWIKRIVSTRAHWWFAYTARSAEIVGDLGFPSSRITVVENAIDTRALGRAVAAARGGEALDRLRALGLHGAALGIYVGGLYEEKRLPFLFEAAELVRRRLPGFELVVAGDGPDRATVERAVAAHPWMRYVGPTFGHDKAVLLAASKVLLMPGAVGLAVLDAFAAGLPLATTDVPFHGPEIEYLEPGTNGVLTPHRPEAYANAVADVLEDEVLGARLRHGALAAAGRYTIENMVDRFAVGVLDALRA